MVLFLFVNDLHIIFFIDNYKEPLIDVLIFLFIIFNNYTSLSRDYHGRNHQRLHRIRKKAAQKTLDEWSGVKCPFICNGFEFLDIWPWFQTLLFCLSVPRNFPRIIGIFYHASLNILLTESGKKSKCCSKKEL